MVFLQMTANSPYPQTNCDVLVCSKNVDYCPRKYLTFNNEYTKYRKNIIFRQMTANSPYP